VILGEYTSYDIVLNGQALSYKGVLVDVVSMCTAIISRQMSLLFIFRVEITERFCKMW
jgi:hypothetical protein